MRRFSWTRTKLGARGRVRRWRGSWGLPSTAIAVALAATTFVGPSRAQTPAPAPLPPKTQETGPSTPPTGTGSMQQGVIRPPATVDPEINKGAPSGERFLMPVLPPPGTPGGNPRVVPK